MKTTTVSLIVLACAGLAPLVGGETGKAEAPKPRTSHAALSKRLADGINPFAAYKHLEQVEVGSVAKRERKHGGSLIGRSTILAYRGFWTMVPKGSVLHVAPLYRDRIVAAPTGKLLPWKQFLARNRGWIQVQAVSMENARGEKGFSEDLVSLHKKSGRIVIAALHNGPISVKAPVPAPAPAPAPSS